MSLTPQALLAELDTTLPRAAESWRSTVLRKITDLFLSGAEVYNDQHVALVRCGDEPPPSGPRSR